MSAAPIGHFSGFKVRLAADGQAAPLHEESRLATTGPLHNADPMRLQTCLLTSAELNASVENGKQDGT